MYKATKKDYFSGPEKESQPFNYSSFGTMNFEADKAPTDAIIDVAFTTTHGSSVYLDHFTQTISSQISLL